MRADLALDECKGARAHHLLPVELLAPGIPTRLTLHDQVGIGGDHIEKFWHRLLEVKDDLVVVADLHALGDFPGHLLDRIGLAYPHDRPPYAGIARGRLRL